MTGRGPVTVSTRASGQAPIAARSFRLVVTAAIPAPCGSAATNEGRMASPPTTRDIPAAGTTAPSSPGPASQSVLSEDVADQPDLGFGGDTRVSPHPFDQPWQVGGHPRSPRICPCTKVKEYLS